MAGRVLVLLLLGAGLMAGAAVPQADTEKPEPGKVQPPRLIKHGDPEYPAYAREVGIQGYVFADVTIGEDGLVTQVIVVRGQEILAKAFTEAIKKWRYKPKTIDGKPVATTIPVYSKFEIEETATAMDLVYALNDPYIGVSLQAAELLCHKHLGQARKPVVRKLKEIAAHDRNPLSRQHAAACLRGIAELE